VVGLSEVKPRRLKDYADVISGFLAEFGRCFKEFNNLKPQFALFAIPLISRFSAQYHHHNIGIHADNPRPLVTWPAGERFLLSLIRSPLRPRMPTSAATRGRHDPCLCLPLNGRSPITTRTLSLCTNTRDFKTNVDSLVSAKSAVRISRRREKI